MALVNFVIVLALLQYFAFSVAVGSARGRYGIAAPATTGNPDFERYYRVQMNTLELLIAFVPGILIFGYYVSSVWAAVLGTIYLLGRVVYFLGYVADAAKRGPGFGLSVAPILVLLLGSLYGAARLAIGF
jgi:uncharacterized membrane protein YecN with MAPEG domain